MKSLKQTEDWIRHKKPDIDTPASMDSRILMDAYAAMPPQADTDPGHQYRLRRILMNRMTKFAVAASIIIAVFLHLTVGKPAYTLAQTIQAFHSVRSIHTKIYYPIHDEPALLWAEFHANGIPKRLRVSQPAFDPHDGPKEVVWENNTAQVWSKKNNTLYWIRERDAARKICKLFQDIDPKLLMQKLEKMQQDGTAQIQIDQPEELDKPITVTATLAEEDLYLGHTVIAQVDQATKLVISMETIKGDGTLDHKNGHGSFEDFHLVEFFDYNQLFTDDIFSLNTPEDAIVIDLIAHPVGLAQGQMTIEETAIAVVRQFCESLMKEDYKNAGLMYGGLTAETVKKNLGKQAEGEILRIISVGPSKIHPNPAYMNKAFLVPCTLEVRKNEESEIKTYNSVVREVDGQPGRWAICGGI